MKLLENFSLISGLIMVIGNTESDGLSVGEDAIDVVVKGYPVNNYGEMLMYSDDDLGRLRADSKVNEMAAYLEQFLDELQVTEDEGVSEI